MAAGAPAILELADQGNGSVNLAWAEFGSVVADSFNVYVDGALRQNVVGHQVALAGFNGMTYNPATQVQTRPETHEFHVCAVSAGIEIATTVPRKLTIGPTSIDLVTPMTRVLPFPDVWGN